jgi:hypothetical protein
MSIISFALTYINYNKKLNLFFLLYKDKYFNLSLYSLSTYI